MSLIGSFRSASAAILAEAAKPQAIHHMGERGAEREEIVQRFLQPLLPERFGIGRGEIRATNGVWSKLQDLIIYDKLNCPRLFAGKRSQIFPAENVLAVIEVKTRLRTRDIERSTKSIQSVRKLKKVGMSTHVGAGSITFGEPSPTLGALFAFDLGLSLETFKKRWEEFQAPLPWEERINLVCVLSKMVIIHADKIFHLWDSASEDMLGNFVPIESGEDSLLTFFLLLTRVLIESRSGVPDLFKHFFSNGKRLTIPLVYKE